MIRAIVTLVVALGAASPALAGDGRLAVQHYSSDEVVKIVGRPGVQTTIAFASDEHIENVAVGNSAIWQVTPNKRANVLFVKPLNPQAATNMTVITDRRTYLFELGTSRGGLPMYIMRFTYPAEAPRTSPQQLIAASTAEPARLNFNWRSRGSKGLLPSRIYDDGTSTFLTWPDGSTVPAILTVNEKGDEGPVNYTVRGDVTVVHGVPTSLLFRSGRDSAKTEKVNDHRNRKRSSDALAASGGQ